MQLAKTVTQANTENGKETDIPKVKVINVEYSMIHVTCQINFSTECNKKCDSPEHQP